MDYSDWLIRQQQEHIRQRFCRSMRFDQPARFEPDKLI
jgi:hypothetical protein